MPRPILFGAAYYHEYQPSPRLDTDLDLMAAAGFSVIRVGESVWSTWEPEDGVFDLEWLLPVLDGAHARGIAVLLGTPTYAVPPWLARRYPEIAAERATGVRIGWGNRQEMDLSHAAYRFHAERVIRAVVGRYAAHPAVIGFQVDNEPGLELLHNHGVFQRFVDELRGTYGDVETLNAAWGLTYWSHRLSTWADLWTPDNNSQPQYDLAWRRFQARLASEFVDWQTAIVRSLARPGQFVTTCLSYDRPAVQDVELCKPLDMASGNLYYAMQDGLALPSAGTAPQGWFTSGLWSVFASADRMFASKQSNFLVTETNAGPIGGSEMNFPGYPGQLRQVAWALVARGASMIEYWNWHSLHYGAETYWGGILPHDQVPGRVYQELAELGAELNRAGSTVAGLVPDAMVGILYSAASKWGLAAQPALVKGVAASGEAIPDPDSYHRFVSTFYRGAFDAGQGVRFVHDSQLVGTSAQIEGVEQDPTVVARQLPVLLVPALYVATDAMLAWLRRYAEAGGHLVLGPRTGYADMEARARRDVKPALLADVAGVSYQEFSNLEAAVHILPAGHDPVGCAPLDIPNGAMGTDWLDALRPDDADVLARYDHPYFGAWPAITTKECGTGRITTIGTVPDATLSRALVDWALRTAANAPEPTRWSEFATEGTDAIEASSVTVSSATALDGSRVHFVHNWSWTPVRRGLPARARDAVSGELLDAGDELLLGPWDVRVFVEGNDYGDCFARR